MNTEVNKSVTKNTNGNIVVKILCVLAAFLLWIYVMSTESPEYETTFSHIVVQLENTDSLTADDNDLAIYNGYGTMIDVTLSGKKSIVSKLSKEDIIVTADVSNITSVGRYDCKIRVDTPAGCKLVGISQETISVYVDKAEQITIDLSKYIENVNLPDGYFTGTIDYPVDKITITGPSNILTKIASASITLDLSGVTRTTTILGDVKLYNRGGVVVESPYIDYYPKTLSVTVPILKSVDVPLEVLFKHGFLNSDNADITFSPAYVTVTGEPSVIDRGNLISAITVDEKKDFSNSLSLKKRVTLSAVEGVELSHTTAEMSITIGENIRTRSILIQGENIVDTGANEGVEYTWTKSPVEIVVMGELEKIASLDPEDIMLVMDMSPYGASNTGTIRVPASVVIDSPYRDSIIEIGVYEISVTFTSDSAE